MARPEHTAPTVAVRLDYVDRPEAIPGIAGQVAAAGGTVRTLSTVRRWTDAEAGPLVEIELEVEGVPEERVTALLEELPDVRGCRLTRSLDKVFGKRLIVVGGGAQIAQAVLGAVSEADRHNLRGEKISVDTIPARALLLAGSIMGGDITRAVRELQAVGIPVICLNMAGSVPEVADLVVTDPVQAGTMAVMGIADTAKFDFARQKGRRY